MSENEMNQPFVEESTFKDSFRTTRACRILFIIFVGLSVAASVTAIVMSGFNMTHSEHQNEKQNHQSGFCMICSELYPEGYVDRRVETMIASLSRYTDDGVQICCARNLSEKADMMTMQLKRRDSLTYRRINSERGNGSRGMNFGPISAHKLFSSQVPIQDNKDPKFGDKFFMLHLRESTDSRYEHVSGVGVTPYGLQVKTPGLYFVYKSVFFMPDSGHPCKHFREQTFTSALLRNSTLRFYNMDILIRSEHTCCPDCYQNRETTFTGGVFYLDDGDLLQVEVSAYGLVYFKEDVTFIGMAMLGSN